MLGRESERGGKRERERERPVEATEQQAGAKGRGRAIDLPFFLPLFSLFEKVSPGDRVRVASLYVHTYCIDVQGKPKREEKEEGLGVDMSGALHVLI